MESKLLPDRTSMMQIVKALYEGPLHAMCSLVRTLIRVTCSDTVLRTSLLPPDHADVRQINELFTQYYT